MHEVGITQSLLDTVLDHARQAEALRVERVILRIGARAGLDPDAIRFAFHVLAQGTIAADAQVAVEADDSSAEDPDSAHAIAVVAIEVD